MLTDIGYGYDIVPMSLVFVCFEFGYKVLC